MSINQLVSIRNPIIDAESLLGIDHDKNRSWFLRLAEEAEKKIGSYFQFERRTEVLDVNGCVVCLPTHMVKVELCIMGDQGQDCGNLFNTIYGGVNISAASIEASNSFLIVDIGDPTTTSTILGYHNYTIQGGKIIFDQNPDEEKVTVQGLFLKKDCDGFLEVGINHIEAIKWYIVWQYYYRQRGQNYIDRDKQREAKAEWLQNCVNARAEDNRFTHPEQLNVANMYNDPYSGVGMWQGMYTTLSSTSYSIW